MQSFKAFLKRKNIVFSAHRYGIDALGAMAQGLFCSLLIGTIIKTLGTQLNLSMLTDIGTYAMAVSGPAMAVAIGYALQARRWCCFFPEPAGQPTPRRRGRPAGRAAHRHRRRRMRQGRLQGDEGGHSRHSGGDHSGGRGAGYHRAAHRRRGPAFGRVIDDATRLQPWMGIAVSVLVGVALTLPISSAAICSVLGMTGLAGGAAVAGCCAQMVGFAVMSFRENRWGGLVSQGLGTSMLQMPNIVKNPRIWIPPTLAAAVTGPIATCLFRLEMNGAPINSGMGTCGLCGPIGVWSGWVSPSEAALAKGAAAIAPAAMDWIGLILICLILPAVLSAAFCAPLRRIGWIREGDLKL